MSLEQAFAQLLQPLQEELRAVRAELAEIRRNQQARRLMRPTYDARQLQEELGFGRDSAYELLHAHGRKRGGRYRISFNKLLDYMEDDDGRA